MSNLKISGLVLLLAAFLASDTGITATIRNGTCVTNISNVKNCRYTKPATHTTKKITTNTKILAENSFITRRTQSKQQVVVSPASAVYTEASRFIGLTERKNATSLQNLTGVNPRRIPWCAAFVNAILNRKGYEGTNSLTAASFKSYGVKVVTPHKGDIVVLRNRRGNHVGIFVEYKVINGRKMVGVLGGNQNNMVKVTYYSARSIVTIRRPIT